MQGINPPTPAQLLAPGQEPLMKLEAYVKGSWVNICNLFSSVGLVGYWPFDEGSGMVAYDHSKEGNDGSLENMTEADWVDGKVDKALDLDGANDHVNCGVDAGSFAMGNGDHTFSAWIYPTAVPNPYNYIVAIGSNANGKQSSIGITDALELFCSAYAAPIVTTDYALPALDAWYHIAMVYNGATDIASFYVNGEWVEDESITLDTTVGKCFIGCHVGVDVYFTGKIDEVRIYNRVLTEGEITALADLTGKNYVEDWSISLGGASPTPNPIAGTWNATLFNEDGIFHPQHPTSAYAGYCVTGREVRISIGATYGGVDYYWQRLIGYMDEPKFSAPDYRVNISGGDYMKMLEDAEFQELDTDYPNHWGLSTTFDSWPSDGLLGAEIYNTGPNPDDAMDIDDGNNVAGWTATDCTFVHFNDVGDGDQPSGWVGRLTAVGAGWGSAKNLNVGAAVAGTQYKVTFKYRGVGEIGDSAMRIQIRQASGVCKDKACYPTDAWTDDSLYFTALDNGAIQMWIICSVGIADLRVDRFSIFEYLPEEERYYDLTGADANQKGPYHVTYDDGGGAVPVQQGEVDEGWDYEAATGRVAFDRNKTVINGAGMGGNVEIFYYTATDPEDAVAKILWFAKVLDPATGLPYADEAAALAAMDNDDPAFAIDKVWFKAGSTFLNAIRMLCERCNYRFYFKYDGTPVFKAVPAYSNLLTDGGLNIWASATDLTHWAEGLAGTSTVNREAVEKIEGDFSCRLDVDAGNSAVYIYQTNISLTPLKRHKIIVWYKNSLVGETVGLRFYDSGANVFLKEDGTWNVGAYDLPLPNSTIWKKFELFFYGHADYSTYTFLIKRINAPSSSIYLDDVSIWREDFTFTSPAHIASSNTYQSRNEIKNRIIIKGLKQAEPVNRDETTPSELTGEAHDDASIAAYGERTLPINNYLFQTQGPLDAMCATLLALYKDPKWYSDLDVPFNPVPLELVDDIEWEERLSHALDITQTGVIRDIKIDNYSATYKCVKS